jgi:DNA-binding IclR family transcriptional regulator
MSIDTEIDQPKLGVAGSQTLMRGLDVIEAIAAGVANLSDLSSHLGLSRSTTHRLAASLVERGYLAFAPREGYRLGAKLLELGHIAQSQADLIQIAHPHIVALSYATEDAVHFGILDGNLALYLDKMPGRRRITLSSRIGDRQPLTSTGLGKALMLDHAPDYWRARFEEDRANGAPPADFAIWLARMQEYVAAGRAFDLEENEDQIRCVAAPVRDAAGKIVGAISVSSAAQYMSDDRMHALSVLVLEAARAMGRDLGWTPEIHTPTN